MSLDGTGHPAPAEAANQLSKQSSMQPHEKSSRRTSDGDAPKESTDPGTCGMRHTTFTSMAPAENRSSHAALTLWLDS
ncbi:hypothetical protein BBOMB_0629 [Bifidobacterium bombi DSM 19703]|uniref:Uncharacterized protein n=1 Tax=Bifidobacterium bombi DSM 19703 TaxID=1341695 RepID=A0A080N2P9_9BIFI|nr:hypothetical protein BBOMB_0629 [Bifidobacterium bombi DSM 19703]